MHVHGRKATRTAGYGTHLVGAAAEAGGGLLRDLGHGGHLDLECLLRGVRLLHTAPRFPPYFLGPHTRVARVYSAGSVDTAMLWETHTGLCNMRTVCMHASAATRARLGQHPRTHSHLDSSADLI